MYFLVVWLLWFSDPEGCIDASIFASAGIFGTTLTCLCIAAAPAFTGAGAFASCVIKTAFSELNFRLLFIWC